ncbi:MAG: CvpA family protein [Rickettsiales bacterium]
MIETSFNLFDSVVIGIMVISCLIAFFRGLVKEILSLVAWVGAGIVTVYYFTDVAEFMQTYFKSPVIASGASAIGLYIIALVGFGLFNMFIIKAIRQSGDTGMLDNMLGLIFGAARGAFIVSLGFFLISTVISKDNYPEWISQSVTHPYAERGAIILTRLAPESLQEISSLQKKALAKAQERLKQEQEQEQGGYNPQYERPIEQSPAGGAVVFDDDLEPLDDESTF